MLGHLVYLRKMRCSLGLCLKPLIGSTRLAVESSKLIGRQRFSVVKQIDRGLIFGASFWNMARTLIYEKGIKTCLLIPKDIFLIFAGNQAAAQSTARFPLRGSNNHYFECNSYLINEAVSETHG
jgi:hypothetical protein